MSYKIKRAGQSQGLIMQLDVGQDQYLPWVDMAGFRVYIHNQSESVYGESVSYSVLPGFYTSIGLKWVDLFIN